MILLSAIEHSRVTSQSTTGDSTSSTTSAQQSYEIMQHCLALLACWIGDLPVATSDHTIASIAIIMALEHGRQNINGLRVHSRGLDRLVALRGGLSSFQHQNLLVADMVFWIILVTRGHSPQRSPSALPHSRTVVLERYQIASPQQTPDDVILDMRSAGIDEATLTMMDAVRVVPSILARDVAHEETDEDALKTFGALYTVAADLLDLTLQRAIPSSTSALSRCLGLSACMQVFAPTSGYLPDPTPLHAMVHDLKTSLTPVVEQVDDFGHSLFWFLAVGALSGHAMPERKWFVGHLIVVNISLGIHDGVAFRHELLRCSLIDRYRDVNFATLW